MDEPSSLTPWKKRKTENEYSLCLICQEQSTVKVIKNPNNESLKKLLSLSRERSMEIQKYSNLLKGVKTYVLTTY